VARVEHSAAGASLITAASAIVLAAAIILLWAINRRGQISWGAVEALLAFAVGGALSNTLEALSRGAVTDFLGVNALGGGTYSAGDLCLGFGISLFPVAAFALALQRNTASALLASAAALAFLVLLALAIPGHIAFAFLAAIVTIVALAWLGARRLITSLIRRV
jgi:hypothetical protein